MVCKYLIRMVRTCWVKTGLISSCMDKSGRNIHYQKVLDLNIFGIQNILSDKKVFNPKFFGLRNIFESKFLDPNSLCYFILAPNSCSTKISSVALPALLVSTICLSQLRRLNIPLIFDLKIFGDQKHFLF